MRLKKRMNGDGVRPLVNGRNKLICALAAIVASVTMWCGNALADKLAVASVSASANDGNVPANALDGSLSTRWSALGEGQWIAFDLGSVTNLGSVKIAWNKGDQRVSLLEIQTSLSGTSWTTVFGGASSGKTTSLESYDVKDSVGQYLRIVGHGNSQNLWNSITEVEIRGTSSGGTTNPWISRPGVRGRRPQRSSAG